MIFFNFLNFFAILLEFSITRPAGTERIDNFYFLSFSSFSSLFLASNEPIMALFLFFNFFAIFLEFSISRRVGTKRNDNFYFLSFSAFSNLFWPERMRLCHDGIFIFSLSRNFTTYFGLK